MITFTPGDQYATAQEEISHFLAPFHVHLTVAFYIKHTLIGYECSYSNECADIMAGNESDLLSCCYVFLEKLGFIFEANKVTAPKTIDFTIAFHFSVKNAMQYHGIRQHINFPMDISSYKLEDAKEYIRNLARMKFNFITFHSYQGQWYETISCGKQIYAGGFFYSQNFPIPQRGAIKDLFYNKNYFVIPEIEPFYLDVKTKSKMAIEWLNAVMGECHQFGMYIQFSFESNHSSVSEVVQTCKDIYKQYPLIDGIEMMTQECGGGWSEADALPVEDLKAKLRDYFIDDNHASIRPGLFQLPGTLDDLKTNIEAAKELSEWPLPITLGIYMTEHDSQQIVLNILRQHAPKSCKWSFLSAHGARAVMESVRNMKLTTSELAKIMIYSWIEFDGSMYMQQNAVTGVSQCVDYLEQRYEDSGILPLGCCFNHWRTEENATVFSFLSQRFEMQISPGEFYRITAKRLGISNSTAFCAAMQILDDADTFIRDYLCNIGFCFEPCWIIDGKLGYAGVYTQEHLLAAQRMLLSVIDLLNLTSSDHERIRFLHNRLNCSIIQIKIMQEMSKLQQITQGKPASEMNTSQRTTVDFVCQSALQLAQEYMSNHAQAMIDHGCEGTLISYYHTMPVFIRKLQSSYGNLPNSQIRETDVEIVVTNNDLGPQSPAISNTNVKKE